MGMNPMMAMNPMMMMMQMAAMSNQMGGAPVQQAPAAPTSSTPRPRRAPNAEHTKVDIDPQVEELCKKFNIEDRIMRRLNDVMISRESTYDKDMKALWQVCEEAKRPSGFLMVKIQELERGVFTGAGKMDRDVASFTSKHSLDDRALAKLLEVVEKMDDKKPTLTSLDRLLQREKNPSQAIISILTEMKKTGRCPSPPREERNRSSDRRQRERSRSRSRRR
mmetsp:Transcript_72151/g.189114  ORF Transcript_72151/g.189114 Transcript_72151/m.189114 type:complete len:221 (+) Transcript_72151:3-665(+)